MAEPGSKLATGWLELTVSTAGAQKSITDTVMPGAVAAGDAAGASLGGRMLGSLKKALPVAAIGVAIGGVARGLYNIGSTFDDVSDTIRVGTGATGANLLGLEKVAKQVGTTVPTSFEAAGSTVADLNTRLGLSGSTLKTVASQYLEAGRVLGQTVDINATSAAFTAFGISGKGVEHAMDDLFRVSQATGVGMNQLASISKDAAPVMTNLGFSFGDTAALVGSLDKAGLNSSKMVMALSSGMVKLAKDGEQPATAFRRTVGELQGFISSGKTAAAIDLAGKVFGTRGATQFVAAIKSGTLNLTDLMGAAGTTSDTILQVGQDTADAAETWQILKNKAIGALQPLGALLFNGLGAGLAKILDLVNWVGGAFTLLRGSFTGLGADVDLGGLTNPIIDLGAGLRSIWDSISPLIPQLVSLWTNFSPLAIILQAIQPVLPQLTAAFSQLASIVGGVLGQALQVLMPVVQQLASILVGVLSQALAAVLPIITQLVGIIGPIFSTVMQALLPIITTLAGVLGQLLQALVPILSPILGLIPPIAKLVGALLPPIVQLFAALLKPILALVSPIVSLLTPALQMISTGLSVVIGWIVKAIDWFVRLVSGNKDAGRQFRAVWDGVMGFFRGIGGFFADVWNGLIRGISGFIGKVVDFFKSIPDKIGRVFAGAGRWLWDAGRNIIDGLINGARTLLGNIGNFFLNMLPGWIVGPFKAALGINSPSKVFAGYGRNTAQGYIDGISSMSSKVQDTVAGVARFDPPAPPASGSGRAERSPGTDGDTYVLNGLTTRETAEEIASEVDKRKRRRVRASGALVTAGVR
nr:phage tail tape measure protein [Microbacterium bovistercoris]